MIFNKLRIFGVIFACVFTLHSFAADRDYYIITLDKNGGTGGLDKIYVKGGNSYNPTGSFTDADKIFVWDADAEKCKGKIDIPTKPGYTFVGYGDNTRINSSGGGNTFDPCQTIEELSGDETWSASWKECESGVSYKNNCVSYTGCSAGKCKNDENECETCLAGHYCSESKFCKAYTSLVKEANIAPLCPVNTYSDAGKTSCTSCEIGYTTGNSGPIVTDSEDNVSGDGLCLAFDDDSGLGYGCISSRACQMVTPQLCKGGCSCNAKDKLENAMHSDSTKAAAKTALTNCGVTELVANCLLGDCGNIPTRPFRPIRGTFIGNSADINIQSIITNAFLENKKLVRCFCATSFVLGDNVTTVKTYSDVVDVVYPDDSASD